MVALAFTTDAAVKVVVEAAGADVVVEVDPAVSSIAASAVNGAEVVAVAVSDGRTTVAVDVLGRAPLSTPGDAEVLATGTQPIPRFWQHQARLSVSQRARQSSMPSRQLNGSSTSEASPKKGQATPSSWQHHFCWSAGHSLCQLLRPNVQSNFASASV
jgi:hypothetical protein